MERWHLVGEILLAPIIFVERRRRNAGFRRNVSDARPGDSVTRENAQRRVQNLLLGSPTAILFAVRVGMSPLGDLGEHRIERIVCLRVNPDDFLSVRQIFPRSACFPNNLPLYAMLGTRFLSTLNNCGGSCRLVTDLHRLHASPKTFSEKSSDKG